MLTTVTVSSFNRQVGSNLHTPGGAKVIEAKGRLVMPGKPQLDSFFHELSR